MNGWKFIAKISYKGNYVMEINPFPPTFVSKAIITELLTKWIYLKVELYLKLKFSLFKLGETLTLIRTTRICNLGTY